MKIAMLLAKQLCYDGRVTKEAKSLLRNGFEVKVLEWNRSGLISPLSQIKTKTFLLRTLHRKWKRNSFAFLAFWFWCFFSLLREDFDAVHCHDLDTLFPGLLAAKIKRRKLVFDAHEHYPSMISGQSRLAGKLALYFEKLLIGRADIVISASEDRKALFKEEGAKKLVVIDNRAIVEDFSAPIGILANFKRKISSTNFLVLYIGGLNPGRSLEELVDAVGNMKRVSLFIAGPGSMSKLLAKKAKAMPNVKVSGPIPFEKIPEYYAVADVIPFILEFSNLNNVLCAPNKVFEAAVAGKPLIVSQGSKAEKLAEGFCVAVDYGNKMQIKQVLEKLSVNKKFYNRLSANAVQAREKFSWKNKNEKTLCSLYSSLQ